MAEGFASVEEELSSLEEREVSCDKLMKVRMATRPAASRAPTPGSAPQRMIWLFLLVSCLGSGNKVSGSSPKPEVVNGILGESAVLSLELPAETETSVVWHYYKERELTATTILIIKLNKSEHPEVVFVDPKWKKQLNSTQTSLQLSNLTMADTGLYSAQTVHNHSRLESTYILRVFKRLRNLQVTNHTRLSENGTCEIRLTCLVDNLNFSDSIGWQASGNISIREQNLTISWDPKNSNDQNYTCRAKNPVTDLSISVSAQSLCKGVLTKDNVHWDKTWPVIIALLFIVILLCMCVRKKRTGSLPLNVHHSDSSPNTDPPGSPGNTVYAQVTHPKQETEIPKSTKNDSMTIYSIVNHSREDRCSQGHQVSC